MEKDTKFSKLKCNEGARSSLLAINPVYTYTEWICLRKCSLNRKIKIGLDGGGIIIPPKLQDY